MKKVSCSTWCFRPFVLNKYLEKITHARAYFRTKKCLGIDCFVKKCPFPEKLFFNLNQKRLKQLLIRGDSTSTNHSGLSKHPFIKQRCPFIEAKCPFQTTILNNFFSFIIFVWNVFNIYFTHFMTYGDVWCIMKYMLQNVNVDYEKIIKTGPNIETFFEWQLLSHKRNNPSEMFYHCKISLGGKISKTTCVW